MSRRQRVAVIGSTGQLGSDLVELLSKREAFEVVPLSHEQADCTSADSMRHALSATRPDVVINCAAFVRVDECEEVPDRALEVNALGALYVARTCAQMDALCVYISTDYVFDGAKGSAYTESDTPRPINVYGTSKLTGEHLVRQAAPRWLIVRIASLFGKTGARGKGGNFVETILSKARNKEPLKVVSDIRMSPTYAHDAAETLIRLVEQRATGILHFANSGSCDWHEFATKILQLAGLNAAIEAVASTAYPTKARRPANSSLSSERAWDFLPKPPRSWPEALKAYMSERGHITPQGWMAAE